MAKRYTMIAIQGGTTTVTWPNIGSPDTGGTGPHAPAGVLTNIRTLEVEEVSESWQNLDSSLMQGTVQGLWHFDGDLTDSSGNGFTLTHVSGSQLLYSIIEGLQCIRLSGSSTEALSRGVNDAALRPSTTMSLWAIIFVSDFDFTNEARIMGFDFDDTGLADDEAHNTQYRLGAQVSTGRLVNFHENGVGVDVSYSFDTSVVAGKLSLVSLSRDGAGACTLYVDGVSYGPVAGSLPTGGTDATIQFRIGGSTVGGDTGQRTIRGYMGGAAVTDGVHTLTQHQAMYDHVRGLV